MPTARLTCWLGVAVVAGLAADLRSGPLVQPAAREGVAAFLGTRFRMDARQIAAVEQGQAVAVLLPGAVDREVVVAGAVRIDAPAERTVALARDIERLESGPGVQTKRLSDPPRLEDFAAFSVTPEDVAALRTCRSGRCDVKLGQAALDSVARIDWRSPTAIQDVHALARRTALDYVDAYRRGGNQELAIYRDTERPLFIAQEFSDMVARTSQLPDGLPELARLLLAYPSGSRPAAFEDLFYWSVAGFGLKPVFRLNHVLIVRPSAGPTRYAIATKQLVRQSLLPHRAGDPRAHR